MSTRSSLIYIEGDKKESEHNVRFHLFHEMHDDLIYLEIDCNTCYSGIKVPLSEHLAKELEKLLKPLEIEK